MRWSSVLASGLLGSVLLLTGSVRASSVESRDEASQEASPLERASYFSSRRGAPVPGFNSAAARAEAVRTMRRESAAPGLPDSSGGTPPDVVWQEIGPIPILNETNPRDYVAPSTSSSITTQSSGRLTTIAIDAIDSAVYVGGANGGVWRSWNNGASWTPIGDAFASLAIGAIAIAPGQHAVYQGTVLVGTGEDGVSVDSYGGVGVYKSTDSGATWSGPWGSAVFTGQSIGGIAIDRTNPSRVIAVTGLAWYGVDSQLRPNSLNQGVFLSTDGGETWAKQQSQSTYDYLSQVLQDPVTPTTWWASGINPGGIEKSIDNGVTWVQVAGSGGLPPLDSTWHRAWITGTANSRGGDVLFVGNGQANPAPIPNGKVFRSLDGGNSWAELTGAEGYCQNQCEYDLPIAVEPGLPGTIYTGGAGQADGIVGGEFAPSLFMRADDGWTFYSHVRSADGSTALHADVHAIAIWPGEPNRIWVGTDGGVWRSDDRGDDWIDVNSGLNLTEFTRCDLDPQMANGVYGGTQDNGTDGVYDHLLGLYYYWNYADHGDGGYALIDQHNSKNLVHTYFNRRNDIIGLGFTTSGINAGPHDYFHSFAATDSSGNGIALSDQVLLYPPIHLDRGHSDTLYFGTDHLYRAPAFFSQPIDGEGFGQPGIFTALNGGKAMDGEAISAIETVPNSIADTDAKTLFVGSASGNVHRSTDSGQTFTVVDYKLSTFVSDIKTDPRNPKIVFAARSNFAGSSVVRRSLDGGSTWSDASLGLPNIPVNALVFDPFFPGKIWAGTDVGVFASRNNGDNWYPDWNSLATQVVDLRASRTNATIVACTHGRGAYSAHIDAVFVDGFNGL